MMLLPAAVAILLVLGAVAVDTAIGFLGHRQLVDATAAAANDAATQAFDETTYRATGHYQLDPAAAFRAVRAALVAQGGSVAATAAARLSPADVVVAAGPDALHPAVITVTTHSFIGYAFSKAIPGAPRGTGITARQSATVVLSPGT